MPDQDHSHKGPLMLAATRVLKPGPARIAKIGPMITLPRTIPIKSLLAMAGGALGLGLLGLVVTRSYQSLIFGLAIGAAAGYLATSYSPLRNESLSTWLGLEASARLARNQVKVEGIPARAFIGVCPVERLAAGKIVLRAGAVEVPPGSVDERGVAVDDGHRPGLLRQAEPKQTPKSSARRTSSLVPAPPFKQTVPNPESFSGRRHASASPPSPAPGLPPLGAPSAGPVRQARRDATHPDVTHPGASSGVAPGLRRPRPVQPDKTGPTEPARRLPPLRPPDRECPI